MGILLLLRAISPGRLPARRSRLLQAHPPVHVRPRGPRALSLAPRRESALRRRATSVESAGAAWSRVLVRDSRAVESLPTDRRGPLVSLGSGLTRLSQSSCEGTR